MDENQEELNRVMLEERMNDQQQLYNGVRDLDLAGVNNTQAMAGDPSQATKKVKISFEEYQRLSRAIVGIMKDFERGGMENVQQLDIINRMV